MASVLSWPNSAEPQAHETPSVCSLGPVSSPVTNQLTDQRPCTTSRVCWVCLRPRRSPATVWERNWNAKNVPSVTPYLHRLVHRHPARSVAYLVSGPMLSPGSHSTRWRQPVAGGLAVTHTVTCSRPCPPSLTSRAAVVDESHSYCPPCLISRPKLYV